MSITQRDGNMGFHTFRVAGLTRFRRCQKRRSSVAAGETYVRTGAREGLGS